SDIGSNITRIEGDQTISSHECQIHTEGPKHLDKVFPSSACLLKSIRPELQKKLALQILVQHALCSSHCIEITTFDVYFDKSDTFAGFEIIVERHHLGWNAAARI